MSHAHFMEFMAFKRILHRSKQFRHPSVVSYFEAYQNRVLITFKPTVPIANQSKDLVLPLSRKSTYHQVRAIVEE